MATVKIYGTLKNMSGDGVVTTAADIKDGSYKGGANKTQSAINNELYDRAGNAYTLPQATDEVLGGVRLDVLSTSEINNAKIGLAGHEAFGLVKVDTSAVSGAQDSGVIGMAGKTQHGMVRLDTASVTDDTKGLVGHASESQLGLVRIDSSAVTNAAAGVLGHAADTYGMVAFTAAAKPADGIIGVGAQKFGLVKMDTSVFSDLDNGVLGYGSDGAYGLVEISYATSDLLSGVIGIMSTSNTDGADVPGLVSRNAVKSLIGETAGGVVPSNATEEGLTLLAFMNEGAEEYPDSPEYLFSTAFIGTEVLSDSRGKVIAFGTSYDHDILPHIEKRGLGRVSLIGTSFDHYFTVSGDTITGGKDYSGYNPVYTFPVANAHLGSDAQYFYTRPEFSPNGNEALMSVSRIDISTDAAGALKFSLGTEIQSPLGGGSGVTIN